MKKGSPVLALLGLTLLSINCSKQSAPPEEETEKRQQSNIQNPIELAAPVANVFTDFSFYFFKALQALQKSDANIFVSPLSLHIALGMLANGAEAETKAQMMTVLRAETLSQEALNDAYKTLLTELPKADPLVKMTLANAIFHRTDLSVEAPFLHSMKAVFNAQITGLPFVPADVSTINQWASDNTNGKIPQVIDELSPNLVMLLMNALYFKGDWHSKFELSNTVDQIFYLENGDQKTVQMMRQTDTFQLASVADFTALQMPYGNGQFRATFILPNEGQTIRSVLNEWDALDWRQIQNSWVTRSVQLGLPKFKLEQDFNLNETLQNMGMPRAFDPQFAELQGINKARQLYIDFVKQNTFVAVDEQGTEAAAVTTIGIETTSAPMIPSFICNKPFGLIISEKTSNTILFMGRIMNP